MLELFKIKRHLAGYDYASPEAKKQKTESVHSIINEILSISNEQKRIKLIQDIILNTDINKECFPSDFDIEPYVFSDNIKRMFQNISSAKILEILHTSHRNNYKKELILSNISYEKQKEIIEEVPEYLVYVHGDNSKELYKNLEKSPDLELMGHWIILDDLKHLLMSNPELLNHIIQTSPDVLTAFKGIDSPEIDDTVLTLGKEKRELLYFYCGKTPEVLDLKRKCVKENYIEFFNDVLTPYDDERIYDSNKEFIVSMFREKYNEKPSFIFQIPHNGIMKHPELFEIIKNHEFTLEEIEKWFGQDIPYYFYDQYTYNELFNRLVKKDIRFFSYIQFSVDEKLADYAYDKLKEDFSNIQYIRLFIPMSNPKSNRFVELVNANMGKYKDYMPYMKEFLDNPKILANFRKLLSSDFTLIQYFDLNSEKYHKKELLDEIKAIEKEIAKKIKENPTACVYYRGFDQKVMDLMIENGGVLNSEQLNKYGIKANDFLLPDSNSRKAIVKYIQCTNLNISEQEIIEIFTYLFSCNEDIMLTANLNLFKEEYIKLFKVNNKLEPMFLRIVFRYPEFQKQLIKTMDIISDSTLYEDIFKFIMIKHPNNLSVISNVSEHIGNNKAIYDIASKALKKYPDKKDQIRSNTIFLLTNYMSVMRVQNEEDILFLDERLDTRCNEIMNNIDKWDLYLVIEALLLEKFGLSHYEANYLVQRYGNLDKDEPNLTEEDLKLLNILDTLSMIVNCKSKEKLAILSQTISSKEELRISESFVLEQQIRQMYGRHLNNNITDFSQMKDTHLEEKYGVKVYEALDEDNPHDFMMLVSSLGAYRDTAVPDDYHEDWLRPKEEAHSFCTSLISSQMLGIARIKHCVLGFGNIPPENLLLVSPTDISTDQTALDVVRENPQNTKFWFPKKLIDQTRHTHNEMVIERSDGDQKILPTCVIFVAEHFNPNGQYFGKEYLLWQHALQAAEDFGIPIVVIDRSKVKAYEKDQINKALNDFKKSEPNCHLLIKPILTRMINNCIGLNNSNLWNKSGFTKEDLNLLTNEIINAIKDMIRKGNIDQALICFKELLACVQAEDLKNKEFNMTPVVRSVTETMTELKALLAGDKHHQEMIEQLGVDKSGKRI